MEQKSSLSKIRKLISVLQKCNGKASVVSSEALISPKAAKALVYCGLLILTGGLAYGAYYVQPMLSLFISAEGLSRLLMMILLVMSFALAIKDIVTVLYTADDLPLLLPMPFSPNQIVMAKLAVAGRFPLILSLILMNSVCLGFGIRAGAGAPFIIGSIVSSILIPVTGIAFATLLVVISFRLFGFIRNRDIIVAMGGIFTLAMIAGYMYLNQKLRQGDTAQTAEAVSAIASAATVIPNIAFMSRFMSGGKILDLLIGVGISAGVIILSFVAVRLFYLSSALAMQNSGTKRKTVTKAMLAGDGKTDVKKALTAYESKNTRRNPAYLIYGFAMTFLWPALIILPMVLSDISLPGSAAVPLNMRTALLAAVLIGVISASFACSFNILPATAFSREGSTFSMMKTMPIDFRDYFKSKRSFSMWICSLGSVLYVVILGIVCLVLGVIAIESCWVILVGALVAGLCDLIYVNCLLLKDARKPYFNWDTDTELSRKLCWINIVAVFVGLTGVLAFIICISVFGSASAEPDGKSAAMIYIICAASVIVILAVSLLLNRFAAEKGAEKLMKFE